MSLRKHSTYYEDRQLDQLSSLADIEGRDVSKILRELADEYIQRNAHKLELRRSFGGGALMKRLGGDLGEGTVLFFGVDRYAELVQGWSAEETGAFLNALYHHVGELVLAHAGRVVKFMGDGGLLLFEGSDHPHRASATALALLELGPVLGPRFRREIGLSIGAAAGEMLIGHFGHEQFFQFDVVGDTVNLGYALRQLARGDVVVNRSLQDALASRFAFEAAGTTSIPGLGGREGFRLAARRVAA